MTAAKLAAAALLSAELRTGDEAAFGRVIAKLALCEGVLSHAADQLGVSRESLRRWCQTYPALHEALQNARVARIKRDKP